MSILNNTTKLQSILNKVNALPEQSDGVELPELSNEGVAADLLSGKQLINSDGNVVAGTMKNNGAINGSFDGINTSSYTIPTGYTTGGTVSLTNDIPNEVATQEALIDEITTIIRGKAAGTTLPTLENEGTAEDLLLGKQLIDSSGNVVIGTASAIGGVDPFEPEQPFTYTISPIEGAVYGFKLNENGYYESQNKGIADSIAICRINFVITETCDIALKFILSAEEWSDYAIFGDWDEPVSLTMNIYDDDFDGKYQRDGEQEGILRYPNAPIGNHFLDIKYAKDFSENVGLDCLQFKIQKEGPLPQTTIDKILEADTDLKAENIKSGVNIFGVVGTYEANTSEFEDRVFTRTLSGSYSNSRITTIGSWAFAGCNSLTGVNFAKCTTISNLAFAECQKLSTISFPKCTIIGSDAFRACYSLTSVDLPECITVSNLGFYSCYKIKTVNLPKCVTISDGAFSRASALTSISIPKCVTIGVCAFSRASLMTSISLPACTRIGSSAFAYCSSLKTVYLTGSTVCALAASNAFASAGIKSNAGSIFVNASLVDSYKTATNWTYFSNVIFAYTASTITFTIDETEYQAEEGMNWEQWVNSGYNPGNFYIDSGVVYGDDGVLSNDEKDIIIANATYTLGDVSIPDEF